MRNIIEFIEVGRSKRSWSEPLCANPLMSDDIEINIIRSVRKSKALMSRDIDACMSDDGETGIVIAGMRTVGKFRIVPTSNPERARDDE